MKIKSDWCVLIVAGVVALSANITLSLHLLINTSPIFIVARWFAPEEIFVLTTLFLLLQLSVWSTLILGWSQHVPVRLLQRPGRTTAFTYTTIVIFPMLTLWFYLLLTIIRVELPALDLWFVAMALSWMTTPFASLGFMYMGFEIGSWLGKMK